MGKLDDIEKSGKVRTSVYLTAENRERLDDIPRGEKTALINDALDKAFSEIERKESMRDFLDRVKTFKRIKTDKSSEELVRELREERSRLRG